MINLYDLISEVEFYGTVTKILVVDRMGFTVDEFMLSDYEKRRKWDNHEARFCYPQLTFEGINPKALVLIEVRAEEGDDDQ